MNSNILPSDRSRVVGVVDPDALTAGDHESGWVDAKDFRNFLAIAFAGTLGTSATFDVEIEESIGGNEVQTLKSATQLTQAGTNQSDQQVLINVRADELSEDYDQIRVKVTVGEATSDGGAVLLGYDARYEPGDEAESVAETVE